MSCVFPELEQRTRKATFNILEANWPAAVEQDKKASLDPPQVAALKHLLTKEVALVQGPPGTGLSTLSRAARPAAAALSES
jgi:ATP-dependent exoDNAse (exonuclease V) alpha subunit